MLYMKLENYWKMSFYAYYMLSKYHYLVLCFESINNKTLKNIHDLDLQ